jgi:hypothetical protein
LKIKNEIDLGFFFRRELSFTVKCDIIFAECKSGMILVKRILINRRNLVSFSPVIIGFLPYMREKSSTP